MTLRLGMEKIKGTGGSFGARGRVKGIGAGKKGWERESRKKNNLMDDISGGGVWGKVGSSYFGISQRAWILLATCLWLVLSA